MGTSYEKDVVAWAKEQAALLRAGQFSALDIEHLAEEIEDVGKSEQRELANRMAVLLAHLLKWQCQPERRGIADYAQARCSRRGIHARPGRTACCLVASATVRHAPPRPALSHTRAPNGSSSDCPASSQ